MKRWAVIILMALAVSVGIVNDTIKRAKDKAFMDSQNEAAMELRIQRTAVERELADVKEEISHVVIGKSCYAFIFEQPASALYTDVMPLMREHGYTGVIALSPKYFPGNEYCISLQEYDYLESCGWKPCIYWDGNVDLESYLEQLKPMLSEAFIDMPKAVYVEYGRYSPSKDEEILNAGFTTVVHHGEKGEIIARSDDEELFHVGCMAFKYDVVTELFKDTVDYGGSMGIYIDFYSLYGKYTEKTFVSMLNHMDKERSRRYQTDLDGLRSNLSMIKQNRELNEKKEYLESEIERYDEEIRAIYDLKREMFD